MRYQFIDIAKGIGILLVVWFHTSGITSLTTIDGIMWGGHCDGLLYASVFYVEWHFFQAIRHFESHKKANDTIFLFYDFSFFAVRGKRIDSQ